MLWFIFCFQNSINPALALFDQNPTPILLAGTQSQCYGRTLIRNLRWWGDGKCLFCLYSAWLGGRKMYIFSEKRKGKKVGIKMSDYYLHNVTGWDRPLLCFTGKKNTSRCLLFLIRKHDWSLGPGRTMLTCRDQRSDQTLGWMTKQ